ncbi:MAG: nitrile hydratase subunit beta [Caulobacteraceae bacterium]|nr:nitrile hydratase subunit beta [Caulobacteraceae bacterium]
MNGVHDMGGMHGLGPIDPEVDEPAFHARWEARVLALTLAMAAWGRWTLDATRHQRELIPGPAYLAMSYYERWLTGLIALMIETGLVTRAEIETARTAPRAKRATPPLTAEQVPAALMQGGPASRDTPAPRRFKVGEAVRARTFNPVGHTRLPRYARGRAGVIARDHGVHVLPDANAHGLGESPERLYGVRFAARDLWGEAARAGDSVHLDLWDTYIDPA